MSEKNRGKIICPECKGNDITIEMDWSYNPRSMIIVSCNPCKKEFYFVLGSVCDYEGGMERFNNLNVE